MASRVRPVNGPSCGCPGRRPGIIEVTLRYTLTPSAGPTRVTRVTRVVTMDVPRSLTLVRPVLVRAFRAESTRTLAALKAYADTLR
jgi:hypothetical protein